MFDKVKAIFEEQLGVSQDEMQLDTNFKDDLRAKVQKNNSHQKQTRGSEDVYIPDLPSAGWWMTDWLLLLVQRNRRWRQSKSE